MTNTTRATEHLLIRLTVDDKRGLAELAEAEAISMSAVCRRLVRSVLTDQAA